MQKKGHKSRKQFLDDAWRIAFDSATYNVEGTTEHSSELLAEAKHCIRNIGKSDWWQIAEDLYDNGHDHNVHRLSEDASSIFINKKMKTKGLIVRSGGDY